LNLIKTKLFGIKSKYIIKTTVKMQFNSVCTLRPLVSSFVPAENDSFGLSEYLYECATLSGEGNTLGGQQQNCGPTLEQGTSEEEESFVSADAHI